MPAASAAALDVVLNSRRVIAQFPPNLCNQSGPGIIEEGMSTPSNWPRNRLLLALPAGNLKRLMRALEPIPCQEGQILLDADSSLDDVFFPDSGVVSVVAVYENGNIIEMATIGREGCTGFQAILGDRESSVRFLVQIPGSAAKMSRADLTRAMGSMPSFRNLMYAYVHAFLEQVLVSGACNGAHSLKERLARWLLMMHDRSDGDTLQITQTSASPHARGAEAKRHQRHSRVGTCPSNCAWPTASYDP